MKKALCFVFAPGPRGNIESWLVEGPNSDGILNVEDSDVMLDDLSLF